MPWVANADGDEEWVEDDEMLNIPGVDPAIPVPEPVQPQPQGIGQAQVDDFERAAQRFARRGIFDRVLRPARVARPAAFNEANIQELDMSKQFYLSSRSIHLPDFKLPYERLEEIQLRLTGCIISANGQPCYVRDIQGRDGGDYTLLLEDEIQNISKVKYSAITDLRSIQPGYIAYQGKAFYLGRVPERIMQQGMNQRNSYTKVAGTGEKRMVREPHRVIGALKNRDNIQWTPGLKEMLQKDMVQSARLSNHVAIFGVKPKIEYKGRTLGEVHDEFVSVSPFDADCPWITKHLREVNLFCKREDNVQQ